MEEMQKKRRLSVYLWDYNIMVGVMPNAILQFSPPPSLNKYENSNVHWNIFGANTLFQQLFRLFSFFFRIFSVLCWLCVNMFIGFCLLLFIQFIVLDFIRIFRHTFERRSREYSMNAEKWMKSSQKMYSIRIARVNKHEHFSFELRFVSWFYSKRTQIYERKSMSGKRQRGI